MVRSHRLVFFAVAVVTGVVLFALAAEAVLVILGGILFALAARGVAVELSKRTHLPYWAAVTTVLGSLVVGGVLLVSLAGPRLVEQLVELAKSLPGAARDAVRRAGLDPSPHANVPPQWSSGVDAKTVATGAVLALKTILEIVSAGVVVFFVGVYGAARPEDHERALLSAVPARYRSWAEAVARDLDTKLTRWMIGRLVAMAFVGITCSIAFALLKVPLAMSLAVVAGLLTFVEYVGAVVSAVPPILMALTKSPGTAVAVAILFTALHLIEGYVLSPLIARRSVRIPPAITLGGQVILATLVGPLGLTFATPLIIVGIAVVETSRRRRAQAMGPR